MHVLVRWAGQRSRYIGLTTGWMVRGSKPGQSGHTITDAVQRESKKILVWARLSVPVLTGPGAHRACTMDSGSLPGRGVDDHPPTHIQRRG